MGTYWRRNDQPHKDHLVAKKLFESKYIYWDSIQVDPKFTSWNEKTQ